ncbi:unnamed protein product [Spirodela intermedia]|uniref:Uncharacterized protein n=1 Tax=Spirodela intermedia TaxID=51605 RepID=A0A7I8JII1_SPIIN|nr:unnamed protein product [Spirodela intermedia]CAA6669978.1 unnamed protein product [Spirodela intermedia]
MCFPEFCPATAFPSLPPPRPYAAVVPDEGTAPPPPSREAEGGCICSPTSHPGSFRCRKHRRGYKWVGRRRS